MTELTVCVTTGSVAGDGGYFPIIHTVSRQRRSRLRFPGVTAGKLRAVMWVPFRAMQTFDGDGKQPEPRAFGPLPPGRHPYTPEQVAYHQRERLIAGLAATVAERGYAATTVGQIAAPARVSRRVFYTHFETKEECFLAAFDAVIAHLRGLMRAAAEPFAGDWPRQVIAAVRAALDFLATEPDLARLCMLESFSAGPALHRRLPEIIGESAPFMAVGRGEREGAPTPGDSTDVALIGTVANRLTRHIATEGTATLPAQLPDLVEFLLTPYVGAERARELVGEVGRERRDPEAGN
jgi:AcrR family transcriptional regulator